MAFKKTRNLKVCYRSETKSRGWYAGCRLLHLQGASSVRRRHGSVQLW